MNPLVRFLKSFQYAWNGIVYTVTTQPNFRRHIVVALIALGLGWYFDLHVNGLHYSSTGSLMRRYDGRQVLRCRVSNDGNILLRRLKGDSVSNSEYFVHL